MVNNILSTGVEGVRTGVNNAQQAAETIATSAGKSNDAIDELTEAVVELKASEQQVQASAEVLQTADEVLGTLIDTQAYIQVPTEQYRGCPQCLRQCRQPLQSRGPTGGGARKPRRQRRTLLSR